MNGAQVAAAACCIPSSVDALASAIAALRSGKPASAAATSCA